MGSFFSKSEAPKAGENMSKLEKNEGNDNKEETSNYSGGDASVSRLLFSEDLNQSEVKKATNNAPCIRNTLRAGLEETNDLVKTSDYICPQSVLCEFRSSFTYNDRVFTQSKFPSPMYSDTYDDGLYTKCAFYKMPKIADPTYGITGFCVKINKISRKRLCTDWMNAPETYAGNLKTVTPLNSNTSQTVLVIGGLNPFSPRDYFLSGSMIRFDPSKNIWEFFGMIPEPRYYHTTVLLNDAIYVIGGHCPFLTKVCETLATSTTYAFSIKKNKWFRLNDMNSARAFHGTAVIDNKIYALGGRDNFGQVIDTIEEFCIERGTWEIKGYLPFPLMGFGCTHNSTNIWIIGGVTMERGNPKSVSFLQNIFSYDPDENDCTLFANLQQTRAYCSAIFWKNEIWVCGGCTLENGNLTSSYPTLVTFSIDRREWQSKPQFDEPRHLMGLCKSRNEIIMIGGIGGDSLDALNQVDIFDTLSHYKANTFMAPIIGCSCIELPKYSPLPN